MKDTCRICSNTDGHQTFSLQERMFGWGGQFRYIQCSHCGCLQIAEVPANLDRFYPAHYYSFHLQSVPQHGIRSRMAAARDLSAVTNRGVTGWLLGRIFPPRIEVEGLGRIPLRREMSILDVGCGRGQLLSVLWRAGLRNIMGMDPYLPADLEVLPGLRVFKRTVEELDQEFDLIMLHHVLEHIEDGLKMLEACRDRLKPEGQILLRLPTIEGEAWERYRERWVSLDAPRHLFLHTKASLELLSRKAGLQIRQYWCDSTAFQFIGSELYLQGLPLMNPDGNPTLPEAHFTRRQLRQFEREARELNLAGRGDHVAVLLTRL